MHMLVATSGGMVVTRMWYGLRLAVVIGLTFSLLVWCMDAWSADPMSYHNLEPLGSSKKERIPTEVYGKMVPVIPADVYRG